ncbi:MAG: hypothetical protein Q3M24_00300 [Candidatus Electrothrix aestuarii]|uniref:Uncharacterized protein n=1 Tax=Candidatus Electrothrix aestuarii TaxID=3062594 RepID=A0AAU8LVP2_9BACT|nr:hypothetical protein [Candidatus Electrothrix aestuarii]
MKQINTLSPTSFFHLWRLCIPTLRPIQRARAAFPYDILTHQTNKDTPTEEAIRRLEINHHAIFQSRNEVEAQMNEARARAKQFTTERISEQLTYLKAAQ